MDKIYVPSCLLEERLATYFQAIDHAAAASDNQRRQLLEKDIQTLMDLMERVNLGKVVTADEVPPPLHFQPHPDLLDELSSRLADYHKALYFADIEVVGNPLSSGDPLTTKKTNARTQQIQNLQKGIQVIQQLQSQAAAGFPVQPEEIPPPVSIPHDDEFVVDPVAVITERVAVYHQALESTQEEGDLQKVAKLQADIMMLEFLLKRAEAKIPIYKRDLPENVAVSKKLRKETEMYKSTVETLTKMSGLSARAAKLALTWGNTEFADKLQNNAKMLMQALRDYELGKPPDLSACPYSLADIQRLADDAGFLAGQHPQVAEMVKLRLNQYKLAALKAKRASQRDLALQHMKVVKALQQLLQTLEKGEDIDIKQLPSPPADLAAVTAEEEFPAGVLMEVDGKSLAEELSGFLDDPGDLETSSPLVGKLNAPDRMPCQLEVNRDRKEAAGVMPEVLLSSLGQPEWGQKARHVPATLQSRQASHSLGTMSVPLNGFNSEDVSRSPGQTEHQAPDCRKDNMWKMEDETDGGNAGRVGVSCIEILKYERSLLQLQGSPESLLRSKYLGQQMEEEKHRLRSGGYDAWLLYLGQVEKDVLQINDELKLLRECRQENRMADLIIKKELAERELAVMRKRLPDLRA